MDTAAIECQVCLRSGGSQRLLFCPTCARNALYEPRIQHAQILLSREALGKEIEQVLSTVQEVVGVANVRNSKVADAKRPPLLVYDRAQAQELESKERTQTILSHVEALRQQTKEMKDTIAKRKASLLQRRKVLTSTRQELWQQEAKAIEPLQKYIEKIESRWNGVHNMTADARIFLCREAASLYGLHQRKRKKGVPGRDSYLIGGVPTVDLRDVHSNYAPVNPVLTLMVLMLHRCIAYSDHGVHKLSCPPPSFDFSLPLCPPSCRDYASFNAEPISPDILTSILLQLLNPAEQRLETLFFYTIRSRPFTSLEPQKPSSTSTLAPRQATPSPCDRRSNRILTFH